MALPRSLFRIIIILFISGTFSLSQRRQAIHFRGEVIYLVQELILILI